MARLEKDQRRAAELLEAIEKLMQVCKTEHEMYFMGILRRPPEEKAQELVRQFHELENTTITNTALGFKAKVLRTRHNSLRLVWVRTLKQIEDGTYKRHRFMADVRDKERQNARKKEDPEVVKAEVRALARGQDPEKAKAEARRKLALARGEPDPATVSAAPAPPATPAAPATPSRPAPEPTRRPAAAAIEDDDDDLFDAVLGAKPQRPALRPAAPAAKDDDDDDLFDAVLGANPKKQSLPPAPSRATPAKPPPPVPASVASDDDDAIFDAALSGQRPAMKPAAPKPLPRPTAPSPDPSRAADAIMRTTGSMRAVPSPQARPAAQPPAGHEVGTESLYREYQSARRNAGEAGGGLSADALKSTLAKQREQIKAQYGVADVRFRVVVEDGKSKVKAIPIK